MGIAIFALTRSLLASLIQLLIPPKLMVRKIETTGFIADNFVKTKRLVWLEGVNTPLKLRAEYHPREGDECISKEYRVGKTLLHAKVIYLASKESDEFYPLH